MPEPTDPANARLALRRLVAGLIRATPREVGPFHLSSDPEPTTDEVLALLDSDEAADYEQVLAALSCIEPPRFGMLDWNGHALLDLAGVRDPHGDGRAEVMIAGTEVMITALAVILNRDPDQFDTVWKDLNAAPDAEPF